MKEISNTNLTTQETNIEVIKKYKLDIAICDIKLGWNPKDALCFHRTQHRNTKHRVSV